MSVKLAIGHLVRLKSDGPWMTVTKDRPEAGSKFVEVAWFEGAGLRREVLPKDALEPHPSVAEEAAGKAKKADKDGE